MIISSNNRVHPNIPKHVAELLGENFLDKEVHKKLCSLNFYLSKNGMEELEKFLMAEVDRPKAEALLTKVNNYIYTCSNPMCIVSDYVNSKAFERNIRKKISAFNNNRNYTFDYEAIRQKFKEVASVYYVSNYDLDSNGIVAYLTSAYETKFVNSYSDFIIGILNDRCSVADSEDGTILIEQLTSVKVDTRKATIDFPKVVKNIYEASKDLFTIDGEVRYDLFSHYLSQELNKVGLEIKEDLHKLFYSERFSPYVEVHEYDYGRRTVFTRDTIRRNLKFVLRIELAIERGLTLDSLRSLFLELLEMDRRNTNKNIGNLFVHKAEVKHAIDSSQFTLAEIFNDSNGKGSKKPNTEKFISIVKGIVSMKELKSYLNETGLHLYREDVEIFRSPHYYKRFTSFEDYFLLKDVSKPLIEEAKSFDGPDDNLYYFKTNDECFDDLVYRGNFSSLKDYMKVNLDKRSRLNYDPLTSLKKLRDYRAKFKEFLIQGIRSCHANKDKFSVWDFSNPEIFDFLCNNVPSGKIVIETIIFYSSPAEKEEFLRVKDSRIVFRYCNMFIVLFDHFLNMFEKALNSNNYSDAHSILTLTAKDLFFPESLDTNQTEVMTKFNSNNPLNFFLKDGESLSDISIRKQYSLIYQDFLGILSHGSQYLKDWILRIEKIADELLINFSSITLPSELKLISLEIMSRENLSYPTLESFAEEHQVVGGFIYKGGSIYKSSRGYVHVRGYFVNPDLGNLVSPIDKSVIL